MQQPYLEPDVVTLACDALTLDATLAGVLALHGGLTFPLRAARALADAADVLQTVPPQRAAAIGVRRTREHFAVAAAYAETGTKIRTSVSAFEATPAGIVSSLEPTGRGSVRDLADDLGELLGAALSDEEAIARLLDRVRHGFAIAPQRLALLGLPAPIGLGAARAELEQPAEAANTDLLRGTLSTIEALLVPIDVERLTPPQKIVAVALADWLASSLEAANVLDLRREQATAAAKQPEPKTLVDPSPDPQPLTRIPNNP